MIIILQTCPYSCHSPEPCNSSPIDHQLCPNNTQYGKIFMEKLYDIDKYV